MPVPLPPFRRLESGHELTVTAKQTKTRQRKYVGAFRRTRQEQYAAWKGRVGVHVEYEEIDLKKLVPVIYSTLSKDWELVDCYDVVRLWLPAKNHNHTVPAPALRSTHSMDVDAINDAIVTTEEDETDGCDYGEMHASMPEVYVFGFGAVVFWNFNDESDELAWIRQHLSTHTEVLGLRHNPESIDTACDEMGFCYGNAFHWRRDVVQLHTMDAGEKMAVSFAFSKSANLSIYEWRMEQAVRRNAHIPEALAEHGELQLKRKEIDGEIGRLYLLNNAINLTTNMLDTPEELWDDDRFQPEYDKSLLYLDVFKRIKLLNKRLEVLKDLNKILMDAAQNHHAATLEWIVILLIIVWLAVAK